MLDTTNSRLRLSLAYPRTLIPVNEGVYYYTRNGMLSTIERVTEGTYIGCWYALVDEKYYSQPRATLDEVLSDLED